MVQLNSDSEEEGVTVMAAPLPKFEYRKPISPYVCSTPEDFDAERVFLAQKIFPAICNLCRQRGTDFTPVDLRWKPNDKIAISGHLLHLSLDYISKCCPYFICLLGQSYGPYRYTESAKLPSSIKNLPEDATWLDKNYMIAASAGYKWVLQEMHQNCSLPELEIIQAAFLNDTPYCHFYYRQPEHLDYKFANASEEEMKRKARIYLPEDEYADLNIRDLKQRIVNKGLPVKYFKTLDELGDLVLRDWTVIMDKLYPPLVTGPSLMETEEYREWIFNESFAQSRQQVVVMSSELRDLENELTEFCSTVLDEPMLEPEEPSQKYRAYSVSSILRKPPPIVVKTKSLMVLTGDRGSGKSTLVSNWLAKFSEENSEIEVLCHYVGCSSHSRDITVFMKRCIHKLRQKYLEEECGYSQALPTDSEIPGTFKELCECFLAALSLGPCVLVVDGVDELGSSIGMSPQEIKGFQWIPLPLPPQCRLVVTTSTSDYCYSRLSKRPDARFLKIPTVTTTKLKHEYLEDHMQMHFHHLKHNHLTTIYEGKISHRPLFLSLLGNEIRAFSVYTELTSYLENVSDTCSSIRDFYIRCFKRWMKDYSWTYEIGTDSKDEPENEYIGWVPDTLRLLAVSRSGLQPSEILTMLDRIGYREELTVTLMDWLQFCRCAGTTLCEKPDGTVDFSHQHMKEIVEYVLLRTVKPSTAEIISRTEMNKDWKEQKKIFHLHLVQYFMAQPQSQRRTEELPWQLLMAGDMERLQSVITSQNMFLSLVDESGVNPSNLDDLKLYWYYLQAEGVTPTDTYKGVLVRYGVLPPDLETSASADGSVFESSSSQGDEQEEDEGVGAEKVFTPVIPKIYTTPASDRNLSVIEEVMSATASDTNLSKQMDTDEKEASESSKDQAMDSSEDVHHIFMTESKGTQEEYDKQSMSSHSSVHMVHLTKYTWHVSNFLRQQGFTGMAETILLALNDRMINSFPLLEEDQLLLARVQDGLGHMYRGKGDSEGAERWYKKSLRTVMDMRDVKEDSALYPQLQKLKGHVISAVGHMRLEEGLLDDAEDLLHEALDIAESSGNLTAKATILFHMGILRYQQDDYLMAETSLRNAILLREQWYGKSHTLVAEVLYHLAQLMADINNDKGYDKVAAEEVYRRALDIREHYLGKDHQLVADILFELGKLLKEENSYAPKSESVRLLRRALDIRITKLGGDHIDSRAVRQYLNQLEVTLKMGKYEFGKARPSDTRTSEQPYSSLSWRSKDLSNIERRSRLTSAKTNTTHQVSRPSSQISRQTSRPGSLVSRTGSQVSRPYSGREDQFSQRSSYSYLPPSERLMLESDRPRLLQRKTVERKLKHSQLATTDFVSDQEYLTPSESGRSRQHLQVDLDITGEGDPHSVRYAEEELDSFATPDADKVLVKFSPHPDSVTVVRSEDDGRDTPQMKLYKRYAGTKSPGSSRSIVPSRQDVKSKRPWGSARSTGSSFYTTASIVSGVSAASTKSHQSRCDIPQDPHSIHVSNARTTTMGPHSSLRSLLGDPGKRDISFGIHHKSAWYHVPGRYTTLDRKVPPKRSQKRAEAKDIEKAITPPPPVYRRFRKEITSTISKQRVPHTCEKGRRRLEQEEIVIDDDYLTYDKSEFAQQKPKGKASKTTAEGTSVPEGLQLSPTVSGLTPVGSRQIRQMDYILEEPMSQQDVGFSHSGTMVTFGEPVIMN